MEEKATEEETFCWMTDLAYLGEHFGLTSGTLSTIQFDRASTLVMDLPQGSKLLQQLKAIKIAKIGMGG